MELLERYQTEAEYCLSEAAALKDRRRRAVWEALARRWLDLAKELKADADHPTIKRQRVIGHARDDAKTVRARAS